MVLPKTISEVSPLDPLLLLPLPTPLPSSQKPALEALVSALEPHLSPQASGSTPTKIPIQVLTSQMRQITRNSQILLNAARVGAAEARSRLDEVDVDLRGVEYERARVREEIERCVDYAPAYLDMELSDVSEFLAKELAGQLPAIGDEGYEHALMIARLEAELAEIIQREELLANLTKERDAVVRSKKEIKSKFDAVDVYLTDFAKTANAVASKVKDVAKVSGQSL